MKRTGLHLLPSYIVIFASMARVLPNRSSTMLLDQRLEMLLGQILYGLIQGIILVEYPSLGQTLSE